ncbi:unnamed protein product, partial [Nesidiocoris tenuis]
MFDLPLWCKKTPSQGTNWISNGKRQKGTASTINVGRQSAITSLQPIDERHVIESCGKYLVKKPVRPKALKKFT